MKPKLKYLLAGLIGGCVLMLSITALAEPLKTYLLVRAEYSVYVEGEPYEREECPFSITKDIRTYRCARLAI